MEKNATLDAQRAKLTETQANDVKRMQEKWQADKQLEFQRYKDQWERYELHQAPISLTLFSDEQRRLQLLQQERSDAEAELTRRVKVETTQVRYILPIFLISLLLQQVEKKMKSEVELAHSELFQLQSDFKLV